jgi:hypothetical protein
MDKLLSRLRELDDQQKIVFAIVISVVLGIAIAAIFSYINLFVRTIQ